MSERANEANEANQVMQELAMAKHPRNLAQARPVLALLTSMLLMFAAIPASGGEALAEPSKEYARNEASGVQIFGDLILARPLYLGLTMAGAGLFTISLPFTAWGGNMDHAAEEMVRKPARYTFKYPLGTF